MDVHQLVRGHTAHLHLCGWAYRGFQAWSERMYFFILNLTIILVQLRLYLKKYGTGAKMATLSVKGLDESLIAQLRIRAECLNTNIDELVKHLIERGLNSLQMQKTPDIDSLFGIIPSTTDGLELQNAMREE